ncbi:MAG: Ig-like domain-containing protein [Gemmatimonadaceae bacterium]
MVVVALVAAALQQATPQAGATQPRIIVRPASAEVAVGDSVQLSAEVRDAAGNVMPNARVIFRAAGGSFEGRVDSTGNVVGGATGTIPVTVIALVDGQQRPLLERAEVRVVPGPATRIVIEDAPRRLVVGQSMALDARSYSALGDERRDRIAWRSSAPAVVRADQNGTITAVAAGRATITAAAGDVRANVPVEVARSRVASVRVIASVTDAREGDVVRFTATARGADGTAIPGVTPTWSVSPGNGLIDETGAFVGYEPGDYTIVATFGAHSGSARITLGERDVRRSVTVVGRLPRARFRTEEIWLHPDGRYAYLGTGRGGDVLYAIDTSDPSKPFVTDSIVANTRRVNDIVTTADGSVLVFTREGAADRRNGIVICDNRDPAHPKPIAEFTEGVTSGVHSLFFYETPRFGRHLLLTNDGTGELHILNLDDSAKPREVARWATGRPVDGRTLHDIDVRDGLAYLSYWNDGLVVLDIGNGAHGGTPSAPKLVTQYTYDLDFLYRDVERSTGPGFIRGTHTAWRHKNYVFIADEVFPARPVAGATGVAAERAYGRLHVLDVSDMKNPKPVAWYEPEFGGVHNLWIAGDTLYMGAYEAGFRAFDISGELRGDLRAQKREIAHVHTASDVGHVTNAPRAWGVIYKDGLAYVNDNHNGLWVVRIEPKAELVP